MGILLYVPYARCLQNLAYILASRCLASPKCTLGAATAIGDKMVASIASTNDSVKFRPKSVFDKDRKCRVSSVRFH